MGAKAEADEEEVKLEAKPLTTSKDEVDISTIEDDKTESYQKSTSTAETSSMKTKIVDEMLTRQMSFDISEEILDFGKTEDEVDVAGGVRRRSLRSVSPPTVEPKKSKKTALKEKDSKSKDPEIKPDKKQTES